jgi:hypothetical protein
MAYRKRTTRRMQPESRKLARLINDLQSVTTRLKNFLPVIQQMELESRALKRGQPAQSDEELFK